MGRHKKKNERFDLSFDARFIPVGIIILFAITLSLDTENEIAPKLGLNIGQPKRTENTR